MSIKINRRELMLTSAGAALSSLLFPGAAFAAYPTRNINWILMWRAGGGADTATRIFLKYAEKMLGKKVIVQNITGGGGAIGYTAAKSAKPDGYTLVTIQGDLPKFEPKALAPIKIDDFDIAAAFAFQSPVVVVRADAPWKSLEDFVKDMKDNPGKRTIGISDIGGTYHQPTALWADAAGFKLKAVTFPGSPQQAVALLGGHVDATVTWVKPNIPYVKEGKLKFLGYMGSKRLDDYPDVPTLSEVGYDVVWEHPYGIGGPKGMPKEALVALEETAKKVWEVPEFQAELDKLGLTVMRKGSADYRAHMHKMQSDMTKALKLIQG
ncbi:MAG: tripartite tricarboxylate transporter substrate binding protein [Hyphomicrobiaceae bacterium]|nr:tripartite tricarboxylate transporter substrate binding protein [Hyphomicrobiaceae bacterium]